MKLNDKSKKVELIIYPYFWDWVKFPFRGIDRYNYELVEGLKKLDVNLEIFDWGFIRNNIEGIIKEFLVAFRLIFRKADIYHAVHAMGAKWAIILNKRPLITTIHDILPLVYLGEYDSGFKYFVKRYSIKFAIKKSDKIIVGSTVFRELINEKFGTPKESIHVVYDGIDHSRFFPGPVRDKAKTVLYLGEVIRGKGADSLIMAFRDVLKKIPDAKLIMAGQGRELDYMKDMARDMGITESIDFMGAIPEKNLPALYHKADVFCFPSRFGAGLSLWEAMASGLPVVSGNRFDTVDCVADAGIRTDPDKPEQIANALEKLLNDKNMWLEYRQRGLEHVKKFSWDRMSEETVKVYSEFGYR